MIDEVLYSIMRIQCMYIQLSKYESLDLPELKASLDLCMKLLEIELQIHKKPKKPRQRSN
jgi:hypothetical protein